MTVPMFQIDAFTAEPFRGNPAAVCFLDAPRSEEWMQRVATEMNLSETAFITHEDDAYGLRWFTPTVEVSLCGHATLASAHALWESKRATSDAIRFRTRKSGVLVAKRVEDGIELDLPVIPWESADPLPKMLEALGIPHPVYCGRTTKAGPGDGDYIMELDGDAAVRAVKPDFTKMRRDVPAGVMVTAASKDDSFDFVSRYFASAWGIDEDPVTGSAHCTLVPYWMKRLGKDSVTGFQASARGGTLRGRVEGDRAKLTGKAVTVLSGELVA